MVDGLKISLFIMMMIFLGTGLGALPPNIWVGFLGRIIRYYICSVVDY
ncbi:hypothetical protein GTW56_29455 [Bacillus sp. EB93]|nr:hypothetical protein [Peribacillus frigoritolerans]